MVVGEILREMSGSIRGGIDRQIDIFRGWPRRGGDARGSPKAVRPLVLHYNRAPSESLGLTWCRQACRRSLSVAGRVSSLSIGHTRECSVQGAEEKGARELGTRRLRRRAGVRSAGWWCRAGAG